MRMETRAIGRDALLGAAYLGAFLLLDWASFIHPFQGLNITPWNPQPALAVALLLRRPRWIWLVWIGLALADAIVRGVPTNWLLALGANAAMALTYAAIARAAHVKLGDELPLSTRGELYWFTAITIGGALVAAAVYVGTVGAASMGAHALIVEALGRYWVGDAVGLLVTLPMLVMLMHPARRPALLASLRNRELWASAAVVGLLVIVVFDVDHRDSFRYFYLLLLPVVWTSARIGITGAVLISATTQLALIAAIRSAPELDLTVFELQMLMAAITMTGLMLGVAVDERERSEAELKGSLRLAAAGQMAAALAHELSQPLTALNNYAEASQALASNPEVSNQERLRLLSDISSRMAAEAMRASEVVKRLRDFFRVGSTQLQRLEMAPLLREAVAGMSRRAQALGVQVDSHFEDSGCAVLMDAVQIGVVLRNLLANALDAVGSVKGSRLVAVRAAAHKDTVLVEVLDSGAGVSEGRLHALFEPGTTDKPGGMGVGLSICRAIIEAHGGSLWAVAGGSGHFCFTLPLDRAAPAGGQHAP